MNINPKSLLNLAKVRNGPKARIHAVTFRKLLIGLIEGVNRQEAAEVTGCSPTTISRYLRALHKPADKNDTNLIYISEWVREPNCFVPVFSWGPGLRDKPRPKRITSSARNKRYREDQRARRLADQITGTQTANLNVLR